MVTVDYRAKSTDTIPKYCSDIQRRGFLSLMRVDDGDNADSNV